MLAVQWAVEARNHLQRKSPQLVVLPAAHGNELLFGNHISTQHILGALCTDHRGMSLECDLRNIQNMVVMRVGDENKIRSLDVCADGRYVRRRDIIPPTQWPRVSRSTRTRCSAWWLWPINPLNIGINQDDCCPVADFPSGGPQPLENDLSALFTARRFLLRKRADSSHNQS